MGNGGRAEDVKRVFDDALDGFSRSPRSIGEFAAGDAVALDDALNSAKNMFGENRVWAGPSTPHAAEQGGGKEQRKAESGDAEKHHPQVLWHECKSEDMEAALFDIEKECRAAIDLDPRKRRINQDERNGKQPPRKRPWPAHIGGLGHVTRTIGIDRCDRVEVWRFEGR